MRYFIGLGTNCGEREENLRRAIALLQGKKNKVIKMSSIYETEPVDFPHPAWFLNQVIEIETELKPRSLLKRIQAVEKKMGRRPEDRNKLRVIDIDILMADSAVVEDADLKIPHPRLDRRNFVLIPFAEIAPDVVHPGIKVKISDLKQRSEDKAAVKRIIKLHRNHSGDNV